MGFMIRQLYEFSKTRPRNPEARVPEDEDPKPQTRIKLAEPLPILGN